MTTKTRAPSPRGKARPAAAHPAAAAIPVVRVQTGIRMEQRLLKVLKALAECLDLSVGDLLEGVVLHAFEGKAPFSPRTLQRIAQLKDVYGLELGAEDSHRLVEQEPEALR